MAKRNTRKDEAQIDELGSDLGQAGSDSAGQSGDVQGLSQVADVDEESVGELAETEQHTRPKSWRVSRTLATTRKASPHA